MKLAQLLSLYNNLIRREQRNMRKSVTKQSRQRTSAFVLESLENRVLLSATPMDVPTTTLDMTATVVTTDKADYSPGETAVITTSNTSADGLKFGDGEQVQFQVTRTDGIQDYAMGNLPWYVTDGVGGFDAYQEYDANGHAVDRNADGMADLIRPDNDGTVNGSISTNWFVEDQYLGASLQLTATGQASGAVATTEFTDSAAFTSSISPTSVTYGSSGSITLTVTNANTGNSSVRIGSFTVAKPSGFTISGNPTILAYDSPGTGSPQTWIYDSASSTTAYWAFKATGTPAQTIDNTGRAEITFGAGVLTANTVGNQTFTVNAYSNTSYGGGSFTLTGSQASVNITAATPTMTLTAVDATYTGSAYATSNLTTTVKNGTTDVSSFGTLSYVYYASNGTTVISAPTNAGSYFAKAVFTSNNAAYNNAESTLDAFSITAKALTITGFASDNKVYDGNTTAVISNAGTLSGVVSGETVGFSNSGASFSDKNVANTKTVTLNGVSLTGSGAETNYSYTATTTDLSDITAKALTITVADTTKVFGQTINLATVLGTTFNTGVNGETLSISHTCAGTQAAALVGSYAVNGSVSNGTGMLSNYNVTINPGTLTVTTPSVITTVHDGVNLIIVGTGGCDTIAVNASNPGAITVNGVGSYSVVGASGHVIVYGMACDDNISLTGNVNLEAHGGVGNDTITGGAGHDVIFGDTGNDTLTGAAGNDVIVGGSGSDRLVGSAGHDILISGDVTGTHNGNAYDYDTFRLISNNWAAANASADPYLESPSDDVVDEFGSADQLTGSSGRDWFIIGSTDKITDINSTTKDGDKISYS